MIQSTKKVNYGDLRVGTKLGFIRLEIAKATTLRDSLFYEIEHFAIVDDETGAKMKIADSYKTVSVEQYNQLSAGVDYYIQEYDTTALTPFQIEQLRLKIGFLMFIKSDFLKDEAGNDTEFVVWGILPSEFEMV